MSRRRHTSEQIIRKLAEGQKLLAGGMTVEDRCREFTIAESTWARWLSQYGGMKANDAKRLKELEKPPDRDHSLPRMRADNELQLELKYRRVSPDSQSTTASRPAPDLIQRMNSTRGFLPKFGSP